MINGSKVNRLNDEKFMFYMLPFGVSEHQKYKNSSQHITKYV